MIGLGLRLYYAFPARARLLHTTPAGELAGRYPGRLAGTIGDAALPSPDSMYVIIGHTAEQMARTPGTIAVTTIATTLPASFEHAENPRGLHTSLADAVTPASGIDFILAVVALALLAPVLIFIATATRLSAARREQRFAAMRLVGERPRQISVIAAVESTVAAAAGWRQASACSCCCGSRSRPSHSLASRSSPPSCRSACPTSWRWRSACPRRSPWWPG